MTSISENNFENWEVHIVCSGLLQRLDSDVIVIYTLHKYASS